MRDHVSPVAVPTSMADMFMGGAAREIRAVLSYVNSSAEHTLKDLKGDGLKSGNGGKPSNESSTESTIHTAVNIIADSVTENFTSAFDTPSGEENSTVIFELKPYETNSTFLENYRVMNSTLIKNEDLNSVSRNVLFLGAVVLVLGVILIAHLLNLRRRSRDMLEDEYTPSQVVANYRARYPRIDEEEEIKFEFGRSNPDTISAEDNTSAENKKNETLISPASAKPKKKRNCSPLSFAWDFDGKIVAQVSNEAAAESQVKKMVDIETQTSPEEIDTVIPEEQIDKLKEEYDTMVALLTDGLIED